MPVSKQFVPWERKIACAPIVAATANRLEPSATRPKADLGPLARRLPLPFVASAVFLALVYGVLAGRLGWFPSSLFARAETGFAALAGDGEQVESEAWYFKPIRQPAPPPVYSSGKEVGGVNLVTSIERDTLSVRLMAMDGKLLHRWAIDWFAIWPDATHVPERLMPREPPGTHIHGAALLPNGDLVFNFEHLGLVRLDPAGKVVWRLAYQTHHSVRLAEDGMLWVCGQRERTAPMEGFPGLRPPFVEDTILVVAPEGRIVREWSIPVLLRQNGREGLLHLGGQRNFSTYASGDITHLNHVEPFPKALAPGFFGPGDVLVSLRNVNTVLVFEAKTDRIKFVSTGQFVRQHDPHFVDGSTLSVFDNGLIGGPADKPQSRIALLSAPGGEVRDWFVGTPQQPFFTPILGRHQWLADGHLLITDSCAGRAFELDRERRVVWWFINYVDASTVGAVEQVERLPAERAAVYR